MSVIKDFPKVIFGWDSSRPWRSQETKGVYKFKSLEQGIYRLYFDFNFKDNNYTVDIAITVPRFIKGSVYNLAKNFCEIHFVDPFGIRVNVDALKLYIYGEKDD